MKILTSVKVLTALLICVASTPFALAHEAHNKDKAKAESGPAGSLIKADAAGVSAEWLAKAKADYPLNTCMVSEDKLEEGDMGPPQDMVYRQEGQPDRLVRLCCTHCVRDFKKDPAKYLKMIDDAAAAKAKPAAGK
jgi:hypothetical protein